MVMARTVRRVPESDRWDVKALEKLGKTAPMSHLF